MLNILKYKLKNRYKTIGKNPKNFIIKNKEFIPSTRNWKDSIYTYNKNTLSLIPIARKLTIKLIKAYFNLQKFKLEKGLRKKRLRLRLRRISTHKIFISDGQLKHTNDKITLTIYFYNRQLSNYLYKISKRFKKVFRKFIFNKKLLLIKKKGFFFVQKQNRQKNVLIKALAFNNKTSNLLNNNNKSLEYYENKYYKRFIKKSFRKIKLYMYYKQLIYINKSKFNNSYLEGLINLIKKIYNKNIQLNLINVKYFYVNSNIITQSLILKLRKNRRKLLRYLKTIIKKTQINNITLLPSSKYIFNVNSLNLLNINTDTTNLLLYDSLFKENLKFKHLKQIVLNNIKYKKISGIRLQATGRLTKRYTASRSISKIRYKGNLVNISSSFEGNPSVMLRGYLRPNLEFTKLNSKTRIGSFGIKGWVSGI